MTLAPDGSATKLMRDIGEKELIRRYLRPLFNPKQNPWGVGDDCAVLRVPTSPSLILASTDRVPSDLIAFRAGWLDWRGLGDYLVRLNLSDIAASGGAAIGLLLNLGFPSDTRLEDAIRLCEGAAEAAARNGCSILGGDLSESADLSISATSIGWVAPSRLLARGTAQPGDLVFVTRPIGLTPAALFVATNSEADRFLPEQMDALMKQFHLDPMLGLAGELAESGFCTSCMDNTDGVGQTLSEIADESGVGLVLEAARIELSQIVREVADLDQADPVDFALGPGADFSLVGTLRPEFLDGPVPTPLRDNITVIGHVQAAKGLYIEEGDLRRFRPKGWEYFTDRTSWLEPPSTPLGAHPPR